MRSRAITSFWRHFPQGRELVSGATLSSPAKMIGYPDLIMAEDNFKENQKPLATGKASPRDRLATSSPRIALLPKSQQRAKNLVLGGGERARSGAKLVIVEGNIGVGKTTLTRKLANELGYKLFQEPTTENPFLEKFYSSPHRYALPLQLWILRQRFLTYLQAVQHSLNTGEGAVLDRSVYSDCVFARVCHSEGYISSEGFAVYQRWRARALEGLPLPHLTLFLDAPPHTCFHRIQQRARECESGVPLDYLQKLHDEYHKFVSEMRLQGSLVLKFDWSTFNSEKKVLSAVSSAEVAQWSVEALPAEDTIPLDLPLVHSSTAAS